MPQSHATNASDLTGSGIAIDPIQYFRECVDRYETFLPIQFDCADENLRAFRSKEEYKEWFGHPPFPVGNPYRDEGFYTRELATVSLLVKPRTIVEIGTSIGMGTLMLRILNLDADIFTIDNRKTVPAADGSEYPVGYLAKRSQAGHRQMIGDSAFCAMPSGNLFFVDGDHSYTAVRLDSRRAFQSSLGNWAIIWHDYNSRHKGVIAAVNDFCAEQRLNLTVLDDSSTVYARGETSN